MNVCVDIQPALSQGAGVGRYTRELAAHLGECRGTDTVRFFYFDFRRRGPPLEGFNCRAVRWCPGAIIRKSWEFFDWPPFDRLALRADVFHFPNFIIPPLASGRAVVTVHDASFMRYPEMAEEKNLAYLKARMSKSIRRADAIITDSRFSAGEIVELFRADPGRVFPIPLGVAGHLRAPERGDIERFRRSRGLDKPYLLTVGTLEPRKNTAFLAEVFEALNSFDGELVIAGMRGWKYEPILERLRASPREGSIRYLEYVGDEELPALYAGAELFLFPSVYEGFGFPPLEAMACGTPVIASTAGSLPEVLGDGAILVGDFDAGNWAHKISRLLADNARRKIMSDRGRAWVSRYTWSETARQTWEVYRKAAS